MGDFNQQVIFIGGLTDGLLATEYVILVQYDTQTHVQKYAHRLRNARAHAHTHMHARAYTHKLLSSSQNLYSISL